MKIAILLFLLFLAALIILPAFAEETPLTQKYLNWNEASQKDLQAVDAFMPESERCYKSVVGEQERIPREKAISLYECRKREAEKNLIPHAMFPELFREYYAAQIQTATDYQNGKIEREESNQKKKEAEDRLFEEYGTRADFAEKATRSFECSALYYVAGETQENASPWQDKIGQFAYETLLSSVSYLNLAYTAPEDTSYFKSNLFENDLAQALKEEKQYWRTNVKSDTPYLQKTMNVCMELLPKQQELMDILKSLMKAKEL